MYILVHSCTFIPYSCTRIPHSCTVIALFCTRIPYNCTFLYILVHSCTLLYILVHSCTFLYIIVHLYPIFVQECTKIAVLGDSTAKTKNKPYLINTY